MLWSSFPILETKRTILREMDYNDSESVYRIYNDPKVAEYDVFTPINHLHEAWGIIENHKRENQAGRQLQWGIARKTDNILIGTCSLMCFNVVSKRCEVGYGLISSEWGKGYMTEALKAVIDHGFKEFGLNRIEAWIVSGNSQSIRLLNRLGFAYEGEVREREFFKGSFHNEVMMALLRKDYMALQIGD